MNNDKPFTEAEWEACLKVLGSLKDNPYDTPDNQKFATLIAKISKNAKKISRKDLYAEKKSEDLEVSLQSEISSRAVNGQTLYYDVEQKQTVFSELQLPKNCYCCNKSYTLAHFFYNRLCESCSQENYKNRFVDVDLSGRIVILTGGRVKIGYATALKVLRSGARLVLTTRFPALAKQQLQLENDYEQWSGRLFIYGLDLRNINAIQEFANFFKSNYGSLDILINNAAQTIKYDNQYYLPLVKKEQELLGLNQNQLLPNKTPVFDAVNSLEYDTNSTTEVATTRFGQPVDTREKTSWNSTLIEVSLHELVEVNLINQIAPYLLIKELKKCMLNSDYQERFIINVTSSEGIFSYGNKTKYHPHTNMTKAALNMMTLTSAKEFAEENIFMSSVDVGWVSTGAVETLRKQQFEKGYIPPLDAVDGAARIFHPISEGLKGNCIFGVLLKNYKIAEW